MSQVNFNKNLNLPPGVHTIKVWAQDALGNVGSHEITVTVHEQPSAPSGLTAEAGNAQVALSWDAVPDVTGYALWRSDSAEGEYTQIWSGAGTTHTDSGLTNDQTYHYKVQALTGSCASELSGSVSATPEDVAVPGSYTNDFEVGSQQLTLVQIAGSGSIQMGYEEDTVFGSRAFRFAVSNQVAEGVVYYGGQDAPLIEQETLEASVLTYRQSGQLGGGPYAGVGLWQLPDGAFPGAFVGLQYHRQSSTIALRLIEWQLGASAPTILATVAAGWLVNERYRLEVVITPTQISGHRVYLADGQTYSPLSAARVLPARPSRLALIGGSAANSTNYARFDDWLASW